MPTVLRVGGYQSIIFTSDHPPAHIHVRREGKLAKVSLDAVEFERIGDSIRANRAKYGRLSANINLFCSWNGKSYTHLRRYKTMSEQTDRVVAVEFQDDRVYLRLADGRVIGNPLEWHPWLASATAQQRANVEMYELSVYFPDLDEGLDVEEMLKGIPPRQAQKSAGLASP
jgi:hypothetical protein